MRTLPFVVKPKRVFVNVKLGREEIGIIEIEKRGYLTVSEKTFVDGGGVGETMHFFVVRDKNDKNYNRVGYSIDETITDYKQGNEFEKLYFENNKLPKKYNVKDLIYLQQRDTFTQKDRFGFESVYHFHIIIYMM